MPEEFAGMMPADAPSIPGKFKIFEYHIELDPKFKPRIQTPHKVALSIEPKLNKELDQMERQGIIDKPTDPTEWLNNVVIREKKL